ncbi:MAG: hypothetical protein ABI895_43405 [Deltaproteobacteria bacterium]
MSRRVAEDYAKLSYHPAARREFEEAVAEYDVDARTSAAFALAIYEQVRVIPAWLR